MQTAFIPYYDQTVELEAYAVFPKEEKCPAILICHSWSGRDAYACQMAHQVAEWGYVGFALDLYGKGVAGQSKEENAALKKPFLDNRALLQTRLLRSFNVLSSIACVDQTRIASLGFGFGGLAALDLARACPNLKAAISIYGHFDSLPQPLPQSAIKAKIALFHGYKDPFVSMEDLQIFQKELTAEGVDWQSHVYANTYHAFTNPLALDPTFGTLYNPTSTERTMQTIKLFLSEIF